MENLNLLHSEAVEEKIYGLIRCQQYLQHALDQNIEINYIEYLEIIVNSVSPKFLIQMLHTKFEGPNFTLQNVAISLFEIIGEKSPHLLLKFSIFCSEVFDLSFQENTFNKKLFDLAMTIKGLSKLDSLSESMFVKTLEFVCSNSLDSLSAFGGLIEITSSFYEKLLVSSQYSKMLRDILIQGLKSSAREKYRDNFLIATMVFLARLDPSWTTNSQDSKFIMFIVSLICGEFRLLLQEISSLVEQVEDTACDIVALEKRSDRGVNLLCVCFEIFDLYFSFLVGETSEVEGPWQNLPGAALQLIQKEMIQSVVLFLQFVRVSKNKSRNSHIDTHTVVARGIVSLTVWIREDESLHPLFVDAYESLIDYSRIPIIDYHASTTNIPYELQDKIRSIIFQSSNNSVMNIPDFGRCVGGIGSIVILQQKPSKSPFSPENSTENGTSYHLFIIIESILDPFLSTLDTILTILSAETVSERLTSVAIIGVPYIYSTLCTLLFDIFNFVNLTTTSTDNVGVIHHQLSLCSMITDYLFAMIVSSSNQMMNSLEISATSTDPEAGEYLRVSAPAWKALLFQIHQITNLGSLDNKLKEDEMIDFHNLLDRLRSLEEIFQNIFHI